MKTAEEKYRAAEKAHAAQKTPETEAALTAAAEGRRRAEEAHKLADAAASEAQKAADLLNRKLEEVFTKKEPGLDAPLREVIERTF